MKFHRLRSHLMCRTVSNERVDLISLVCRLPLCFCRKIKQNNNNLCDVCYFVCARVTFQLSLLRTSDANQLLLLIRALFVTHCSLISIDF